MNRTDRFLHWLLPKFFKFRDIHQHLPCVKCKGKRTWTWQCGEVDPCHYCDGVGTEAHLYLRRYFIYRSKNFRIFLHNIRLSDQDRDLHDHPWDFKTTLLSGAYNEKLPNGLDRVVGKGYTLDNKAEHTHALRLLCGPMWTLVRAGPARRVWGFHTQEGWKDWRTYLGLPPDAPDSPEDLV